MQKYSGLFIVFFLIWMPIFSLLPVGPAWAGPQLDCEGSAAAYRLQGIPCDCINGKIVCNQSSGRHKGKHGFRSNDVNAMMTGVLFEALFTSLFTSNKANNAAQQEAAAYAAQQAAQQAQLQRARAEAAQAEFEKMMRSYKRLDNAQDLTYKTLPGSIPGYKSLDDDAGSIAGRPAGKEQTEFETMNAEWMQKQRALIEQRLKEPNKYASAIYKSLTTNAPPKPYKRFSELQAGDVLLLEGEWLSNKMSYVDNKLSSGHFESGAAHTVLYLKEVNGKKLFLDNQPGQGPRIISEAEFLETYGHRKSDVARLAQPLRPDEAKKLYEAAQGMAQKNNRTLINGHMFDSSNYGVWNKDNVVCSEADWAVINAAGRDIPESDDKVKVAAGVNWSPADFANSQYFLVTPLIMKAK
jgi:hypothetical protein